MSEFGKRVLLDSVDSKEDTDDTNTKTEPSDEQAETDQQADGFGVDVYQIVQTEDEGPAERGEVLGVAVDMPNAGVYVDWNIAAWPEDEQLSDAHVSDYATIEDLAQVTQGELQPVESVVTDVDQKADDTVTLRGLSDEALEYVTTTYDVDVL